jgi:hypothetical protein
VADGLEHVEHAAFLLEVDAREAKHPLTISNLTRQLDETSASIATLTESRQRLETLREGWMLSQARLDQVQTWFQDLATDQVDAMPLRWKRQVLEVLGTEVVVMPAKKPGRYQEPHWTITIQPLLCVASMTGNASDSVRSKKRVIQRTWRMEDDECLNVIAQDQRRGPRAILGRMFGQELVEPGV